MKKEKLHMLIIWILLFIFTLTVCSAFLQPHYTHDTYKIVRDGYEYYSYDKFMKEARPITAIVTILAGVVDLPIEVYMVISFIIAVALLSLSVVILYKIFESKINNLNTFKKAILILISYIVIFGYLTIEHIVFLETCIMSLGVLLSVIASKIIIGNEKYKWLKAFLMLFIGVFCYQGSIAIFPIIIMAYYAIIEPLNWEEYIKLVMKTAILYGISMFLSLMYVKVFFGASRIQMGQLLLDIDVVINILKELVINSLGVIPKYLHIGIIAFTTIFILCCYKENIKKKLNVVIKYLLIILAAISICIMPAVVGSGLNLEPRMAMAYGNTIGISLLFIYWLIVKDKNAESKCDKIKYGIVYAIVIIAFILTAVLYNTLTIQHIQTNKYDKEICEIIDEMIAEHEEKTGIKITKIAATYDDDQDIYMDNVIHTKAYNQRALSSWASREAIIYYTRRPMDFVIITKEQFIEFFNFRDWKEFSEEQVVIKGDTIYFCRY